VIKRFILMNCERCGLTIKRNSCVQKYCGKCEKIKQQLDRRKYYLSHKELEFLNHKLYIKKNEIKVKLKTLLWKEKNKDNIANYFKEYRNRDGNKQKHKSYNKKWNNNHIEKRREYSKNYRINNKEKVRLCQSKCHKKRYKIDIKYNLRKRLQRRLRQAICYYLKRGVIFNNRCEFHLNYNEIIPNLIKTLPTTNLKELSNWHIDHIRPISSFDFNSIEEIKKAFSSENLQWLSSKENGIKGKKWSET